MLTCGCVGSPTAQQKGADSPKQLHRRRCCSVCLVYRRVGRGWRQSAMNFRRDVCAEFLAHSRAEVARVVLWLRLTHTPCTARTHDVVGQGRGHARRLSDKHVALRTY